MKKYLLLVWIGSIIPINDLLAGNYQPDTLKYNPFYKKYDFRSPFKGLPDLRDYEGYPDPFITLQLGAFLSFINTNTVLELNPPNGTGTAINLRRDLGFNIKEYYPRADMIIRVAKRHQIGLAFWGIGKSHTQTLNRTITYGDTTFSANASATAKFNFLSYTADYRFSIVRRPMWEVGVMFAAKLYQVHTSLRANLNQYSYSQSKSWYAPLGMPGIHGSVYLTKFLLLRLTAGYFTLKLNNFNFYTFETRPSLEVYPIKNVGIGAAYMYFVTDIKKEPVGTFNGKLKYGFNAVSFFASIRF